jgi:hypothetical protein
MSADDDVRRLLGKYLEPPSDPNPDMAGVKIRWIDDNPKVGSRHIAEHGVKKIEVEEVLLMIPPYVEAKRSNEHVDRTVFWGATRRDRWLFVVCEDVTIDGVRTLTPITAFEPDDGEAYWRRYGKR